MVQELIDLMWRLQRVRVLEARILSADAPDMKAYNNISLHAARMKRQYSATLKELQRIQEVSRKDRQTQLESSATFYGADQIPRQEMRKNASRRRTPINADSKQRMYSCSFASIRG